MTVKSPILFTSPTRQWLNQNWPDEDDRADTIAALAAQLKFKFDYDDREASHSRRLILEYADGTRAVVLFDQGFGYWRATSEGRHNFRQYPDAQAKALLDLYCQVRGSGDSYIAVTRA
ncbi:MAG TPA: hypothetical protein VNI79_04900 [Sphingomicrobium sp.]|nr:hypothetical protein [Sphingomicrobium sp.]